MKNWFMIFCMLCISNLSNAQQVNKMEYFIDTDPGTGKATAIAVTARDTVRLTKNIVVKNLSVGSHTLFIRARNDSGWSIAETYPFIIQKNATPVDSAEYFFDTDPGKGKAKPLSIEDTRDTSRITKNISAEGLQEGYHTLYIRFRDTSRTYSHTEASSFYVTSYALAVGRVDDAEYFIDTDPGVGKAKPLAVPNPVDTLRRTYSIKLGTGIAAGAHYLAFRVKNADGRWSLYAVDTFTVTSTGFAVTAQAQQESISATENKLLVFPNPATNYINVALKNNSAAIVINIIDMKGSVVRSFRENANKINTINITSLSLGTYLLQTNDGTTTQVAKFVKQ